MVSRLGGGEGGRPAEATLGNAEGAEKPGGFRSYKRSPGSREVRRRPTSDREATLTSSWAVPPRFAVQALTEESRSPSAQVQRPGYPSRGASFAALSSELAAPGYWPGNPGFPDPFSMRRAAFGGHSVLPGETSRFPRTPPVRFADRRLRRRAARVSPDCTARPLADAATEPTLRPATSPLQRLNGQRGSGNASSSRARKRKKKYANATKKTTACSPTIVTPAICWSVIGERSQSSLESS
jgi:hypothetical protein